MMKKALLFLAICFQLSQMAFASVTTSIAKESGPAINGALLTVQCDKYDDMVNHTGIAFNDKRSDARVTLKYTGENKKMYAQAWSVTVNFTLKSWNRSGTAMPAVSGSVKVEYSPATGASFKDIDVFSIPNTYRTELKVNSKTLTGDITAIPDDVILESVIETERYYPIGVFSSILINGKANNVTSSVEASWELTTAEEYDLEWVFISTARNLAKQPFTSQDWDNATRITTTQNSYTVSMVYNPGTLYFRVRLVGRKAPNYDMRMESNWSYSAGVPCNFGTNRNWEYAANYAEDGKVKEVLSFSDGSGRVRQAVTKLNTENKALVTESMYDFEGRPAIQTLPAPFNPLGTGIDPSRLDFYKAFSLNSDSWEFSSRDFDKDALYSTTTCKPVVTSGMKTTQGASNYYSSSNPDQSGFNAAIPDAKEFPYAQTVYDLEGRVKLESDAGSDFKIGSNHENKYFTSSILQLQLDRLFGNDVGEASHYVQRAVMDANGQISVKYTDLSGKVIASFLSGDKPSNLDPLGGTATPVADNFDALNKLSSTEDAIVIDAEYFVTSLSEQTFEYTLSDGSYSSLCSGPHQCVYDLTITIFDECSQPVADNNGVLQHTFVISGGTSKTFKVNFPRVGTYKIRKKLSINQAALDAAVENFKAHLELPNECVRPLSEIVEEYNSEIDLSDCNPTECDLLCQQSATASGKTPNSPEWIEEVANCKLATCSGINDANCDVLLDQLKEDMKPGGQYFDNKPFASNGQNEWLNNYAWQDCDIRAWEKANFKDASNQPIISWASLRANWKDEFLTKPFDGTEVSILDCPPNTPIADLNSNTINGKASLVAFHPEYCSYEWCVKMQSSTLFDVRLTAVNTFNLATTMPATNDPYIITAQSPMGLNTLDLDPYFNGTGEGVNQKGEMYDYLIDIDGPTTVAPDGSITGSLTAGMWDQSGIYAGCTNCDLQWEIFSAFYVGRKADLVYVKKILQGCSYLCDASQPADLIADQCGGNTDKEIGFEIREPYFKLDELVTKDNFETYATNIINKYYISCNELSPGFVTSSGGSAGCVSIGSCLCDQFKNYTALYNHNNTDENPDNNIPLTLYEYVAQNLNLDYSPDQTDPNYPDNVVTAEKVQTWMQNCGANQDASPEVLNEDGEPVVQTVPSQIQCDSQPEECQEDSYTITNYYATMKYEREVYNAVEKFIAAYKKTCLQTNWEHLSVECERHDYQYTLYYYDRAGNLIKTVPPEGVRIITDDLKLQQVKDFRNHVAGVTAYYPAHQLLSHYQYNSFNDLVRQNTPDGGETFFWYNDAGLLRYSRNAKQAAQAAPEQTDGPYCYTKYDPLGRIIEAGEGAQNPLVYVPGQPGGPSGHYVFGTLADKVNDATFPTTARTEVIRTIYDQPLTASIDAEFSAHQRNLRSRIATVTYEDVDDGDDHQNTYNNATHYSYDVHGNVSVLLQENKDIPVNLGGPFKKIEYDYDLISGNVNQVVYQRGLNDQFYHRYKYDADNRLKEASTSSDGIVWATDAKHYYYLHGPLARMELGDKKVQGLDYAYTVQGWLKGVNNSKLDPLQDIGKDGITGNKYDINQMDLHSNVARDEYAFSLQYFTNDYRAIKTAPIIPGTDAELTENFLGNVATVNKSGNDLFNGNIKMMTTALMEKTTIGLATPMPLSIAHYRYDQLSRITSAAYQKSTNNKFSSAVAGNEYKSSYEYDGNGNITRLKRNTFGDVETKMDDLTYRYDYVDGDPAKGLKSNRLLHVNDAESYGGLGQLRDQDQPGNPYNPAVLSSLNYEYDEIGNLVKDKNEKNTSIKWKVNGKIKEITHDELNPTGEKYSDLEFIYDPHGNRIMKIERPREFGILTDEASWVTTYYILDATGNMLSTYKKWYTQENATTFSENYKQEETTIYGATRLGRYNNPAAPKGQRFTANIDDLTHKFINRYNIPGPAYENCEDLICPVHYYRQLGKKQYELTDHLGNVLSVVSDNNLPIDITGDGQRDYFRADLISSSDYYPFGSLMQGRESNPQSYRYGFNGKENDNELKGIGNSIDYGARMYDPRLGRWLAVDMEAKSAPSLTPYRFGFNNPIRFKDPNGKWEEDGHFWTIYAIGISMGLERADAYRIAVLAEYPDHFVGTDNKMILHPYKIRIPTIGTWADEELQLDWHGLTGGLQSHVNSRAKSLILGGNLIYFHTLGDSWAHSYINEHGQRVMYGQHGRNEPRYAWIARRFCGDITFEHAQGGPEHGQIADNIRDRPIEYSFYVNDAINIFNNSKFAYHSLVKNYNPDRTIFQYVQQYGGDMQLNSFLFRSFVDYKTGITEFSNLSASQFLSWTGYLNKMGVKYTIEVMGNRQVTGLGNNNYRDYDTYNVKISKGK